MNQTTEQENIASLRVHHIEIPFWCRYCICHVREFFPLWLVLQCHFFMSQNSNKHNIICFITWSHYPSWHKHGKQIKPSLWIKPIICYINYQVQLNMSKLGCYVRLDIVKFYIFTLFAGADPRGTHTPCKTVIFHTKYPNIFRTSLRSAQLF